MIHRWSPRPWPRPCRRPSCPPTGGAPVYEPLLAGLATIAFVDAKRGLASERQVALALPAGAATLVADWTKAAALAATPDGLAAQPAPGARFLPLPRGWEAAAFHKAAAKALTDHLYQRERLEVFELPLLKLVGEPGETRDAFLNRARLATREKRDAEVDKLDRAMQVKLTRLETKQQAEQRDLAEDQAELAARKQEEMLSAGESLLGMFGVLGRKRGPGLATAARKRRMTARAGESIAESQAQLAAVSAELEQLRAQLAADVAAINVKWEQALGGVTHARGGAAAHRHPPVLLRPAVAAGRRCAVSAAVRRKAGGGDCAGPVLAATRALQ